MLQKIRSLSLEKQIFFGFLSISLSLLTLSLGVTLTFALTRQKRELDKNISSIAAYVASMEQVTAMLKDGYPYPAAIRELDAIHQYFPDINVLAVYDANGLRFYHTNRQESGETYVEGEQDDILAGSEPYITTGFGTRGTQRRAFHAVTDQDGTIVGFVIASVFTSYISEQARMLLLPYALILCAMIPVSVLLSHGIVRLLQSSLIGHQPEELLDLYLKQSDVLNTLEEGLIAADREGKILFANHAARRIFPENTRLRGRLITELFPAAAAGSVLRTGEASYHMPHTLYGHPLFVSEIPIENSGNIQGSLMILNDRTEMEALSDELSGAKSMLDTLRAFNHEFLNKLHVILGYLQTGETEKAISFIVNSNLVSSQAVRQTADCLRESNICALVIGKMMHAAELGILLSVSHDSRCAEKDLLMPVNSYITILGNLLENAIEELSACQKEVREITLGVYISPGCSIITCEDTGRGIPPELLEHIYEKGVSSKGAGRGTGLFLIHQIIEEYGGEISIDTEEGEGTFFTLTFVRKENDSCITS